jgi:hypothetical protein
MTPGVKTRGLDGSSASWFVPHLHYPQPPEADLGVLCLARENANLPVAI